MRLVIGFRQVLKVEPRVDLCGRDVGVPQQLLHCPQVTTALQYMACKRMAQHVGVYRRADATLQTAALEPLPHRLRGEPRAIASGKQGAGRILLRGMYRPA